MSSGGGAIAKGARAPPATGSRTKLDLAERLTNLPSASEVYGSSSGRGEGGCYGTASIMGDSMVTPPNQISEAMYLQQEWLGKGGGGAADGTTSTFGGGAGISPTSVAAFPAFDGKDGAGDGTNSSTKEIDRNDHTTFFARDKQQKTKAHDVPERAGSGATAAPQGASSSENAPAATSVKTVSETASRRKKKPDDLLAQMRKTRFFTNSMFSKKKCSSVKSSTSSRASAKKKKAASRSITRPDANIVRNNNKSEKVPDKEGSPHDQLQVADTHSATEHHDVNNHLSSEECVEVRRTSDTVDDVLLGTSSHGSSSGAEGGGNEVVITRVQSPRPLAAIEVRGNAGPSSALDHSESTQPGLLSRPTRPQHVKNRATSSGSQSRRDRRMREVLSSLTFDVPTTSAVDAESRAAERQWGSADTAIERCRSHTALSLAFGEDAKEQSSIEDSLTVDSHDSSTVSLNRFSSLAHSSLDKKAAVEDGELFYDSDPGVVPVRRKSRASLAVEDCADSIEEKKAESTAPAEGGVHMLSMNNSFDDESSLDAMYRLREDEVRNVLEDVSSRRMELIWHPTMSLSHQARFDGHTAPLRCTAWIDSPDESRPTFKWNPCDPHSIMSPERLQASKNAPYDIDLTDVVRCHAVDEIDRAQHPFGRSQNSFIVQTKSGVFLFQAPSRADRDMDMRAIQLLLARFESTKQPSPAAAKDGGALRDNMMVMTIEGLHEDEFIDNTHTGIEVVLPFDGSNLSNVFALEESLSFVQHS